MCVLQECTPFAVIGSNTVVEARGQRVRGRLYPWGIVEGRYTNADMNILQIDSNMHAIRFLHTVN